MEKNKTGKYLKYAIGEIILVVIGILIALQINNLNEKRKDTINEIKYLNRIKSDLNHDIVELKHHFAIDTTKLDSYTYLGRALNSDPSKTNPIEILTHIGKIGPLNWFEGQNIVFEDMKSSGKTFLIKSDSLREKIQIYYRLFNEVIKREELNIENIGKYNDHINSQIKISPLIENGFPERWNASVKINNPNSFKNSWNSFNEKQKNVFKENYSLIKITIIGSHTIRLKLYNAGTELIESIDQYLKNEK